MNIFDLALTLTPRLGCHAIKHLIEIFGSAEAIFGCTVEELVLRAELKESMAESILGGEPLRLAEAEVKHYRGKGVKMIASTDDDYPPLLREIHDPPHVLFIMGDRTTLTQRSVSIVGTRSHSAYGERACKSIVDGLAESVGEVVIVSGLAHGIDGVAHRCAIGARLPTVAVLPTPLPTIRPSQHRGLAEEILECGGALISEMPSTTTFAKYHYIMRNRIIAALSSATVVIESGSNGGSLHTARIARGYDRSVLAIPGHIDDSSFRGCNNLISQQVASICLSAHSIAYELGWELQTAVNDTVACSLPKGVTLDMLSKEHLSIIRSFVDDEPIHITTIEQRCNLPISKISGLLVELELLELVSPPKASFYKRLIPLELI
ncbi:MAG: DNA-processing protein DprA [Rikenellaceae bacterium]